MAALTREELLHLIDLEARASASTSPEGRVEFVTELRAKAKALIDAAACHDGQCSAVGELRAMVEAYRERKQERDELVQTLKGIHTHVFEVPEEKAPLGNRLQVIASKCELAIAKFDPTFATAPLEDES